MRPRRIAGLSIVAIVGCCCLFAVVVFVIEANRPHLVNSGWVKEDFERARLFRHYYDVVRDPGNVEGPETWVCQMLVVFPQEATMELRGGGSGSGVIWSSGRIVGSKHQERWRFRSEDGTERVNSINIVFNEADNSVLIEENLHLLRNGTLFCILVNADMEFAGVEQLDETTTTKATLADFKRLMPDNPAVQSIR